MTEDAAHADLLALVSNASDHDLTEVLTDLERLAALPPAFACGDPDQPMLPLLGAVVIVLGARVLMRTGRGAEAWAWIEQALEAHAAAHARGPRAYVRHTPLSDALSAYPNLRLVVVEALLVADQPADAAGALYDFARDIERQDIPEPWPDCVHAILEAAERRGLGPFTPDRDWLFARHLELAGDEHSDERKQDVWAVYASFLIACLRAGRIDEALDFVRAKATTAETIEDVNHYHFNAVCVLAVAGRVDEAVAAIRDLVTRGYDQLWRFDRAAAQEMWWTKKMGQLGWLAPLEGVPAFEDLRKRYLTPPTPLAATSRLGPFKLIEEDVLGGRARKKCALTRKLIAPGDPIFRFRLVHESADEPLVATIDAFQGEWADWLNRHRSDTYDFTDFRPPHYPRRTFCFSHPAASRFLFDLSEGGAFDVDAFIACISAPQVNPMRFEWVRDKFDYWPEPEDGPFLNDAMAGDFVNLTWVVLRCGRGPELLARLAEIDRAVSDPIFAMLATFEREDCRKAAAAHFGRPDLPETIDLAFASRLSLDDVLTIAEFGREHERFAAALAQALRDYNLHIYSTYHPQVNWYLQGLDRYTRAKGCRLVFFFIHAPERLPVLQTMIERRWLVGGVSSGAFDGYGNTRHSLFQAAVMNRLLHVPDEVPFWLETPWVQYYVRGPAMNEMKRHVAAFAKKRPKCKPAERST